MSNLKPEEVRAIRLKLGMTQRQLAAQLGVNVRTVRRWELGHGGRGASHFGSRELRWLEEKFEE